MNKIGDNQEAEHSIYSTRPDIQEKVLFAKN